MKAYDKFINYSANFDLKPVVTRSMIRKAKDKISSAMSSY